jgi:hypothetical protein
VDIFDGVCQYGVSVVLCCVSEYEERKEGNLEVFDTVRV